MSKQFLHVRTGLTNPGLAADPLDPVNGDFYYNNNTNFFRQYTGGSWKNVGSGTVTSVALTVPSILSVSGSPITSSGTLGITLVNQSGNTVFASPSNGSSGSPLFRSLVSADIPALPYASSTLTDSHLFVGNGSNVATDVAVSGDLSLANTGAFTIANSAITNAKVAAAAAIDFSKLASLTSAHILVGSAGNVATDVPMSGDISITNAGLTAYAGTVPATKGGTAQTTYATGDIIYASASNTLSKRTIGSTGDVLTVAGGVPTWAPASAGSFTAPKVTVYNSGSGNHSLTGTPLYIKVQAIGGGGGGGGSSNDLLADNSGTAGGNTTFGSSLIIANGGARGTGGSAVAASPTSGGSATINSPAITLIAVAGGKGGGGGHVNTNSVSMQAGGGNGGSGFFGGDGGTVLQDSGGGSAATNSGAGGGGAGISRSPSGQAWGGDGGAAGGYCEAFIYAADFAAPYAYVVGSAGSAGSAGNGGNGGGAGSAGKIIVTEYYQ